MAEANFTDLRDIVRGLAQAQVRTEARVEELAQAQARTEARLEVLTTHVGTLAVRMEELAQAQLRTENEVTYLRRTLETRLGGLGARWGIQTEEAFRNAMKTILEEVGFKAKRYLAYDTEGEVFGRPDQVALDQTGVDERQGELRVGVDPQPGVDVFKVGASGPQGNACPRRQFFAAQVRSIPPGHLPLARRQ
jgi:hypothetical protein